MKVSLACRNNQFNAIRIGEERLFYEKMECSHFIPPENTSKPNVVWCFQRVYNGRINQKWVN